MWSFFCAGWMWCVTASRYSPLINGCVWLNNKFQLGLRIASCHTSPWMSFGLLSLEWCLKFFDGQYFAPLSWYTDNTGPLINNWRLACSTSAYRGFLSNLTLHCHWFVNQRVSGFNSVEKSWAIRSIMTLDLACVACNWGQKTSFMSLEPAIWWSCQESPWHNQSTFPSVASQELFFSLYWQLQKMIPKGSWVRFAQLVIVGGTSS